MTNHDHSEALRAAADAAEDAQRALNHLDGLLAAWDEMSDEERRAVDFVIAKPYTIEALRAALARVRRSEAP